MHFPLGVVDEFQHKAIPHEVSRMHAKWLGKLHHLGGEIVRRFEFPPELEAEQALVEPAGTLAIRDAQADVVENRSVISHYNLYSLGGVKSVIMQS
jgi:hypothetical protein